MGRPLAAREVLARKHRTSVKRRVRDGHGQVMTPSDVAAFMAGRLRPRSSDSVLDPGAGLGILSRAAVSAGARPAALTLVEVDATCLGHLQADPFFQGAELVHGDFITFALEALRSRRQWTRIVANPPYLNFHDFDRGLIDRVAQATGVKMTKLSNLFSLFILVAARLLAPGGRMVFITPTEIFTTNYGKRALQQLPQDVALTEVVVFEPQAEPFDDSLTTACITTFERGSGLRETAVKRVHARDPAHGWEIHAEQTLALARVLDDPKQVVNAHATRHHVRLAGTCPLNQLVRVSRGIATGANTFFVLDSKTRRALDPGGRFTVPVIWKAEDVGDGLAFDGGQLAAVETAGRRSWLLYLTGDERDLPPALSAYLEQGARDGIADRYLCRARTPWYAMEGQEPPLAFVGVFGRDGVRVALNAVGARTLACCHRLYHHKTPQVDEDGLLLLVCFLRSALGAQALASQFRRYGGGLMKLEPRDLERVLVPDVRRLSRVDRARLASEVRAGLAASMDVDLLTERAGAEVARLAGKHVSSQGPVGPWA